MDVSGTAQTMIHVGIQVGFKVVRAIILKSATS
jgi:hypothetical protein